MAIIDQPLPTRGRGAFLTRSLHKKSRHPREPSEFFPRTAVQQRKVEAGDRTWDRKGMEMRKKRRKRVAVTSVMVALAAAGSAAAFQQLPAGDQVNNDPTAGINPAEGVSGEAPNADVVGGALVAGAPNVPWAAFRSKTSGADQVFVRSFIKTGNWKTQGSGTVGGRSSSSPTFSG